MPSSATVSGRRDGCIATELRIPERKHGMVKSESREEGRKMGQCSDPHRMLMKGKRDDSSVMGMSVTACLQTSHWYYNQGARRQRFQCQPEICCGCS